MEMPWYSVHLFLLFIYLFIFCLEATLGEDTLMRATSATVLVIFSKVSFRKFPDHNQVNIFSQHLRNKH